MERHPLGIALTTPIQKKKRLTRKIIELSGLFPRGGRGGGVLPYISHIGMCRPIHFAHFGLESGMVCKGIERTTGVYERIYRFNSK